MWEGYVHNVLYFCKVRTKLQALLPKVYDLLDRERTCKSRARFSRQILNPCHLSLERAFINN